MFLAGVAKNALDVARSAIKLPEAYRSGRLVPALVQTITASPTTHLIDPNAPRVASATSAGRSFTHVDEALYKSASLIGVGIGAFQFVSGVPNIYHAVKQGGASAIYDTREGRTGTLQAAGGALTLGAFAGASVAARAAGVRGVLPVTLAASSAASLSSPVLLVATIASSGLVLANDHGFLDFMNRGERRGFQQVERDSWQASGIDAKVGAAKTKLDTINTQIAHHAIDAYDATTGWMQRHAPGHDNA